MADRSVFDRRAALEMVDGRLDILVELAQTFLEHYPMLLSPLVGAVNQADTVAAAKAAHDLRGSLSFFGPTRALDAAVQFEGQAVQGDLPGIRQTLETLQQQMEGLVSSLKELAASG